MADTGNRRGTKKPRGGSWKKGQSGNPSGLPKEARERRKRVAEALEDALIMDDGRDLLIEAIVLGVQEGEPALIKLAAEYRWGKPPERVETNDGSTHTFTLTLGAPGQSSATMTAPPVVVGMDPED
jgi:hypothetical protein